MFPECTGLWGTGPYINVCFKGKSNIVSLIPHSSVAHTMKLCRWELIAGRIPGRTAEEVEMFWSKKHQEK